MSALFVDRNHDVENIHVCLPMFVLLWETESNSIISLTLKLPKVFILKTWKRSTKLQLYLVDLFMLFVPLFRLSASWNLQKTEFLVWVNFSSAGTWTSLTNGRTLPQCAWQPLFRWPHPLCFNAVIWSTLCSRDCFCGECVNQVKAHGCHAPYKV